MPLLLANLLRQIPPLFYDKYPLIRESIYDKYPQKKRVTYSQIFFLKFVAQLLLPLYYDRCRVFITALVSCSFAYRHWKINCYIYSVPCRVWFSVRSYLYPGSP